MHVVIVVMVLNVTVRLGLAPFFGRSVASSQLLLMMCGAAQLLVSQYSIGVLACVSLWFYGMVLHFWVSGWEWGGWGADNPE
jgi:hypothetical protein